MSSRRQPGFSYFRFAPLLLIVAGVVVPLLYLSRAEVRAAQGRVLRVLSYSAFLNSWGPGPEIAKRFAARSGIEVQFLDASDAGLLLKKLELFPSDVVIGIDELNLAAARSAREWRPLPREIDPSHLTGASRAFAVYDWAPMSFVYREGEIAPPASLEDLASERFRGAIALQDPRTSTPGLQFFFWILDELGVEEGFAFLEKLKPNLQSVSGGWSQAYGAFTKNRAKLVFSYFTSPVYHWAQENDLRYRSARFAMAHPRQLELVAIPSSCAQCAAAEDFVRFLFERETQKLIAEKNVMFPSVTAAAEGTAFEDVLRDAPEARQWRGLPELLERREELFDRWRRLGL